MEQEEAEQFRLKVNMLIGTAMKRMLVANDSWAKSRVLREVILDEMNNLNRYFNGQLDTTLCTSGSSLT